MKTDVLIVGGGLSGLALAQRLARSARDFMLIEARDRLGGRIKSSAGKNLAPTAQRYDLGPAWFWPGQERMARVISELGLGVFEQYSKGTLIFEDEHGTVQRDLVFAPMAGSYRLANGTASLINAMAATLPESPLKLQHRVRHVRRTARGVEVQIEGSRATIEARCLVCAVPPRVVADTIAFDPPLSAEQLRAMRDIPTWMAGHAKVIVVYDRPFWREAGFSGDVISRRGPLAEVHDASPFDNSQGALFGFVGLPAEVRRAPQCDLRQLAVAQLAAMFGPCAAEVRDVIIADWATDSLTATPADLESGGAHPDFGLPEALSGLWDGRLILGSSETAYQFGGLLEGALEAAELSHGAVSKLL
jgi:monoamine oxidase